MTTTHDYKALWQQQQERISALGHSLTDEQWTSASLCDGWRVCDVFGHMTVGFATPLPVIIAKIVKKRGNVAAASAIASVEMASAHTQPDLLALYDASRAKPKGIGRLLKARDGTADNFVHELDVRRAIGVDGSLDPALTVGVLDALCSVKSAIFAPAKTAAGFDFAATDVEWTRPVDGAPHIEGPSEDLALAIAGRRLGLAGLTGNGVALLAERIGAPVPVA
jgi:uncharacterized protein (TIGR03083 family)